MLNTYSIKKIYDPSTINGFMALTKNYREVVTRSESLSYDALAKTFSYLLTKDYAGYEAFELLGRIAIIEDIPSELEDSVGTSVFQVDLVSRPIAKVLLKKDANPNQVSLIREYIKNLEKTYPDKFFKLQKSYPILGKFMEFTKSS